MDIKETKIYNIASQFNSGDEIVISCSKEVINTLSNEIRDAFEGNNRGVVYIDEDRQQKMKKDGFTMLKVLGVSIFLEEKYK